jgi:hypothetical protein
VEEHHGPNDERATTTVTWNGCRRGESFEGCDATGDGPGHRVSHSPRAASPAATLRRSERKATTAATAASPSSEEQATGRTAPLPEGGVERRENHGPETWRTPWLAAGCKKPAISPAEKTAEAGRNGKGGTSSKGGIFEPKVVNVSCRSRPPRGTGRTGGSSEPGHDQEWTLERHVDGGAKFDNPKRGVPILNGSTRDAPCGLRARGTKLTEKERKRTARTGMHLRRRGEGHEGQADGHPTPGATGRAAPRRSVPLQSK